MINDIIPNHGAIVSPWDSYTACFVLRRPKESTQLFDTLLSGPVGRTSSFESLAGTLNSPRFHPAAVTLASTTRPHRSHHRNQPRRTTAARMTKTQAPPTRTPPPDGSSHSFRSRFRRFSRSCRRFCAPCCSPSTTSLSQFGAAEPASASDPPRCLLPPTMLRRFAAPSLLPSTSPPPSASTASPSRW